MVLHCLREAIPGALKIAVLVGCIHLFITSTHAQEGPSLQISPSLVISGGQTTAFGTGWCPLAGCSSVTVRVDDEIVLSGVQVAADGTFQATFVVTQPPGQYRVSASQLIADGPTIEASFGLQVPAADFPLVYTPSPSPIDTPLPSGPGAGAPTPTPPAAASPGPTPASTPSAVSVTPQSTPTPMPATDDGDGGVPWYAWAGAASGAAVVLLATAGLVWWWARR